jgi:4-amino-4-deoxy-L-arabinose transferase-like glycosyltransferase
MRASTLNLAIVMAVAAGLRFWSLDHGLPYSVGTDEFVLLERVVAMMRSGDFNPRFFEFGGLVFYAHLPIVVCQFLFGAMAGRWSSLEQVGPAHFYYGARVLTALLGVTTVFVLYQVGLRWGARHALLGAGLLAVMPLHVAESHHAHAEVTATS